MASVLSACGASCESGHEFDWSLLVWLFSVTTLGTNQPPRTFPFLVEKFVKGHDASKTTASQAKTGTDYLPELSGNSGQTLV